LLLEKPWEHRDASDQESTTQLDWHPQSHQSDAPCEIFAAIEIDTVV
jgi:hypothetical protein